MLPGDLGATGGAAPLGGDMAAAGAEGGSEDSAGESEAWAAAVPPVRASAVYSLALLHVCLLFFSSAQYNRTCSHDNPLLGTFQ